jgi:preprotein translocase subunit SecG
MIILSVVLMGLVVVQARTPGMANRDSGSIHRTRRGLEKTLHQATIVVTGLFLLLALIASLPIF